MDHVPLRTSSWQRLGSLLRRRKSTVDSAPPASPVLRGALADQGDVAKQQGGHSAATSQSSVYAQLVEGLPAISAHSNFLWGSSGISGLDEGSEESVQEIDRHGASVLRRSDPKPSDDSDNSESSYLLPATVDESAAMGYVLSDESTEIQQLESSSWDSTEQLELPQFTNWNAEWRRITRRIREFTPQTPTEEQTVAFADLISLSEDFLLAVQAYGRIIISEAHLPISEKTVQPTMLGGVIGGQKYLVHGILFKFSTDSNNIFGGSDPDVSSAKIAGHELKAALFPVPRVAVVLTAARAKGLLAAANHAEPDLNLPLIALVDYKGFRLVAMSQLPISPDTLAVGSADGGLTVLTSNADLEHKMARLGASLNLKGHMCGATLDGSKFLYTPLDLEGHVGTDGNYYLCDFSRMMPPEMPRHKAARQAYLYQLLRREFVASLDEPLCCDAFSQFTRLHEEHARDNSAVELASDFLFEVVVPSVAADLAQLLRSNPDKAISSFRLSAALHSRGVNVRHLYRVLEHAQDRDFRALLTVEMVARVVAADVRDKLRRTTRTLPLPLESHYLKVLCARINLVFGNTLDSVAYWNKRVRRGCWAKFCAHLGPAPSADVQQRHPCWQRGVSFKAATMGHVFPEMPALHLLFVRLQQILGFHLKPAVEAQLSPAVFVRLCARAKPFRASDWAGLGMRVKHMNMVSYAKGYLFLTQGLAARAMDPARARSLLAASVKHFEDCLAANTTWKLGLRACAKALMHYEFETRLAEGRRDEQGPAQPNASALLARADLYCRRAIEADPKDAQSHYAYAVFLDRNRNAVKAELMYREALALNPHHVDTLKSYGDFLAEHLRLVEAEAMYLAARENSRKLETPRP